MGVSFGLTGPICGHTLIINWFNIRRATVLGIIVTGSAVGGFVAQPLIARIMAYFGSWQSGWVTSMIAVNLQTSSLTPPVGFARFYVRGGAPPEVTTQHIYRGIIPFVLIQIFGLALLWFFPWVVTIVPDLIPN